MNAANTAKKVPVTCSQITLEKVLSGVSIDRPASRACFFACCFVASTVRYASATWFIRGAAAGLTGPFPEGFPAVVRVAEPTGFGAVAASTALASVLAACRAPYPSARPRRTLSIPLSLTPADAIGCPNVSPPACIKLPTTFIVLTADGGGEMKKLVFLVGGLCAAAAGFLVWDSKRMQPVEELAHRLEEAWADHHTEV